ncbi:MAG: hypothetical protein RMJ46_01920 [Bacteroidota bacterium]|nr:hypothetical protein [Bacteroidota bacterium]
MLVALLSVVPDGEIRQVFVGDTVLELRPGERTAAMLVTKDSLEVRVMRGGEVSARKTLRLLRRMFHLIVVTASVEGHDTVGTFLQPFDERRGGSVLRLVHVAATADLYGMQLGCPNAQSPVALVRRLSESSPIVVPGEHEIVLSVIESQAGSRRALGAWWLRPQRGRAYSLLVWGTAGKVRVGLVEDTRMTAHPVQQLDAVERATAAIRVLNLTAGSVTVMRRSTGESLAMGLEPRQAGSYVTVSACMEAQADSFMVQTSWGQVLTLGGVLEPFQRYTIALMDSAGVLRGWLGQTAGRAAENMPRARILHAAPEMPSVQVVIGGIGVGNMNSGRVAVDNIGFGAVSAELELPSGIVPLLVQGKGFPGTLLAVTLLELTVGKVGLLCLVSAASAHYGLGMAWIDAHAENTEVSLLPEGLPLQLLQGIPYQRLVVSLPPVLSAVPLPYRGSVATVLPSSGSVLSVGGRAWELTASPDSLPLLVFSGTMHSPELFRFTAPRRWIGEWSAQRRFINASDVPEVDVVIDTVVAGQRSEHVLFRRLPQAAASPFERILLEYRLSFRIRASGTDVVLARVDNVSFPLGGRYSVIFVGNRTDGYGVIVHQEL